MSSNVTKIVEENKKSRHYSLSLSDKSITQLTQISSDFSQLQHLSELILAHNGLKQLAASITNLKNLKLLNCFNNELVELPGNLSEVNSRARFFSRSPCLCCKS
ncbi:Oidioi.mRNA.OKI2018_I69.PAR.g10064.t1.cds [Oikopleura dioica]|uniref:Oidioi.mRNA.OKI2018_I69.PAR.g10064.t1.cds n=1 Tax=Oikopleura dioica TaxID=34765 RepID=A0ABN7RNS0_OIKDI|nr:Oidioi.mRNA.OKI2018_I69.PAR.g10064.t1.cds [Oikopleura dioica]